MSTKPSADPRSREAQRLEKFLDSAGIKLSATASDLLGVSSRSMLVALVAGERSPQVLAELAKGRMRAKIPELVEALAGRFTEHHAFICRMHLGRIYQLGNWIEQLTERVDEAMQPFLAARDFLTTIPGVSPWSLTCSFPRPARTWGGSRMLDIYVRGRASLRGIISLPVG